MSSLVENVEALEMVEIEKFWEFLVGHYDTDQVNEVNGKIFDEVVKRSRSGNLLELCAYTMNFIRDSYPEIYQEFLSDGVSLFYN